MVTPEAGSKKHVLFADDDESLCGLVHMTLDPNIGLLKKDESYEVTIWSGSDTNKESIEKELAVIGRIDTAVIDDRMPSIEVGSWYPLYDDIIRTLPL